MNGAAAAGATGVWRWLEHPWLTTRVQIALGVIFIAAALPKIVDPPSFAHRSADHRGALRSYRRLADLGMSLVATKGLYVQSSCSSRVITWSNWSCPGR